MVLNLSCYSATILAASYLGDSKVFVVLLGPDGCGKTTIAEDLKLRYQELNCTSATILSFNFNIMLKFSSVKKFIFACLRRNYHNKYAHEEGERNAGMRLEPLSKFKALVLFFWYLPDYLLGHFVVWRARRSKRLLIFTRYYYDYYYQRIYANLPRRFVRIVQFIIPKPDKIFLLQRNKNDIYAQKPELSLAEIERQNNEIIRCCSALANFAIIDANLGITATQDQVVKLIKLQSN